MYMLLTPRLLFQRLPLHPTRCLGHVIHRMDPQLGVSVYLIEQFFYLGWHC